MFQRSLAFWSSQQRPALQHKVLRACTRGFTLMEMMIVVAIMGILTAVAYPSYREHIVRGSLVDGTNGLSSLRAQMERYYQDNRSYASVGSFTTPCAGSAGARTFGNFVVSSCSPTAIAFTLEAVGSGPAAGFTFTIDEKDVRATTAAPTGYNTCGNKWLTKKGATC